MASSPPAHPGRKWTGTFPRDAHPFTRGAGRAIASRVALGREGQSKKGFIIICSTAALGRQTQAHDMARIRVTDGTRPRTGTRSLWKNARWPLVGTSS